ncbi:MAG TPA: VOC family protein [Dehalococcoidia bacterium]|nr:VOC family protein [Dehalococcoidia bacterium]
MPVASFDHAAIPTAKPEEMIAFYKKLGFSVVNEEEWRQGKARAFAFAFGDSKINVHPPAVWQNTAFTLRGPSALPGCGDFCFVWDGTIEEAKAMLDAAGAEIIVGPVQRDGGRGLGRTIGTSLYTRDPDQNLLEFMVYA